MARVICELPFASELINGVRFTEDRGQMISEDVPQDVAENFALIRGYRIAGVKPTDAELAAKAAEEAAAAAKAAEDAEEAAAAAAKAAAQVAGGRRRGSRAAVEHDA